MSEPGYVYLHNGSAKNASGVLTAVALSVALAVS